MNIYLAQLSLRLEYLILLGVYRKNIKYKFFLPEIYFIFS